MAKWEQYQVPQIPNQKIDERWEIATKTKKNEVKIPLALLVMSCGFHNSETGGGRDIPIGTYKVLRDYEKNCIMMSDTASEIEDLYPLFDRVRPGHHVLIHGLGLGVAVNGCFREGAEKVTVIEKEQALIDSLGKFWMETYSGLEIRCDDALTWKPKKGEFWDMIWHDIWHNISGDNLPEMGRLHRRFYRRCDWQESWRHDHVRELRREVQRPINRYYR